MQDGMARKRTLRFRMLALFRRSETALLALLAAAVVVLTFTGARSHAGLSVPEAFYAALRSLGGGSPWSKYGTLGDVANWLDLLLVFWVGAKAVMLAFANASDAALARFRRGHTIVCGLGKRGRLLSEALLYGGDRVTVVEMDPKNPTITLLRSQGARVVIGDATSPAGLQAAACRRAGRVIAVLPTDDGNASVARALAETGPVRPPIFVHSADTSIWSMLFDITGEDLTPFSVTDSSCTDVFLECDLANQDEGVVLAVWGTGPLAESIVIRAAKVWQAESHRRGCPSPLPVRVIGPGADDFATRRMALRYPGIGALCAFEPVAISSFDSAEDVTECALDGRVGCATTSIVATGDQEQSVRCAVLLSRCLPEQCQVVVAVPADSGLLALLLTHDEGLANRVKVVNLSKALENPATLLGGKREELARLAHEDWLRAQLAKGETLGNRGSLRHWEELNDDLKASNRDQVASLFDRMLPAVGACIVPVAEWDAEPFSFSSAEVELMAEFEHDRWCRERADAGWVLDRSLTAGDTERKLTPWLVGWDELPEDMRHWDRETVTRFPVLLARAGFRIQRERAAQD